VCNFYNADPYNVPFDKEKIIKKLKIIYQCAKDLGCLYIPEAKFEDVFGEIKKAKKKDIEWLNEGWDCGIEFHNQIFLINSTRSNSIPFEFFELIEELFKANRIHLG
jgi:hypothetical protein